MGINEILPISSCSSALLVGVPSRCWLTDQGLMASRSIVRNSKNTSFQHSRCLCFDILNFHAYLHLRNCFALHGIRAFMLDEFHRIS